MLKITIIVTKLFLYSFMSMSTEFYNFQFESIEGNKMPLKNFRGKVVLLVNTASMCGLTKQYAGLQELHEEYQDKGLVVLGVPSNSFMQEHSSEDKVKDFCETNFNINFPMTEKMDVIGENAHPFFKWAKENHGRNAVPKWNFHKIIIGKDGKVADTFASITRPSSKKFINLIEEEIKN